MGDITLIILIGSAGLVVGGLIGYFILKGTLRKNEVEAREKTNLIIKEAEINAENIKKDKILEAKEKFLQLKTEFEEEANKKKNLIISNENKLKQREQNLSKQYEQAQRKEAEVDSMKENLNAQMEIVKKRKGELEKVRLEQINALEKIANLSRSEALDKMMENLTNEAQTKASSIIKDILEEAKLTANKEAKNVIIKTLQRTATEHTIENCVSIFNIESDDIKGKIIGREGRNIRALEAATGIEIIVDDTPEAIIISGFDPVRREIARLSLHRLVADGRIHPAILYLYHVTTRHVWPAWN
jgi:ribonuclease Y